MGMVDRVRGRAAGLSGRRGETPASRDMTLSLDEWASYFSFGGLTYPLIQTTMGSVDKERVVGNAVAAFKGVSSIFALIQARVQVFSQVRFQYTRFNGSMPGDLFGTPDLAVLEHPWPNGHTAQLLAKMEIDNCITGNAYIVRPRKDRLARLRPDLVTICLGSEYDADTPADAPDVEIAGYAYFPRSGRPEWFWPDEIAHYTTMPDPDYQFLGMSWMTPCLREVQADALTVEHKYRYFSNAATPNLAIKFDPAVGIETVKAFKELLENEHRGAFNAYKCQVPETPIAMWDGRRLRADEVRPGDEVVAWAGEAVPGIVTRAEWQPPAPIITVTTQRGRVLRTTPQHPYLARRVVKRYGRVTVLSDEDWVEAAELRPGDLVRVGLGWAGQRGRDVLTSQQAWALGALTGDGGLTSTTPGFTAADPGILARMQASYQLTHQTNYDYYVRGIRALCVEHGMLGKRSWEKRAPAAIMVASAKVQAAFISGLIDTDGHVSDPAGRHSAEVGITSTSLELLRDVQHLLAGLGVNASVSTPPSMRVDLPGEGLHRHQGYRLTVHGNDQAAILAGLLDLACEPKAVRLAEYATRTSRQRRSLHDRVVSVEIGAPEPTIGLEIAEWHSHVTSGIVTHNTLYLGGGADPVTIGSTLQQLDFAVTQGHGESRLAAAAGVPASWVGFSEGLQGSSLNAGNFNAQRRRLMDGTCAHLWANAAQCLEAIVPPPDSHSNLWYDARIPAMREDAQDIAAIQLQQAQTISALVMQGYSPVSVTKAVVNNDMALLKHSGALSVQLHKPGEGPPPGAPAPGSAPKQAAGASVNGNGGQPAA
jgi:LAGLIDADG DNA endonuclease family protein/portal protein